MPIRCYPDKNAPLYNRNVITLPGTVVQPRQPEYATVTELSEGRGDQAQAGARQASAGSGDQASVMGRALAAVSGFLGHGMIDAWQQARGLSQLSHELYGWCQTMASILDTQQDADLWLCIAGHWPDRLHFSTDLMLLEARACPLGI